MDAERWDRIQHLFHEALQLPPADRTEFVEASSEAPEVKTEVHALLTHDQAGDSLLDHDVANIAGAILKGSSALPDRIGQFKVKRKLGEGGMGVVYLAQDEELNREVAIKLLGQARLSPYRSGRFIQEQLTQAQLRHPSICQLYNAGITTDGTPYFVMEYVEGLPLTEFCERGELDLPQRLRLFRKVCRVVQYAHGQALLHRDLKPSNIMAMSSTDGDPAIKLLDFGIAKWIEPDAGAPSSTRTEWSVMTPTHASPEQMRGDPVGVTTDVYSLGVVLYELLTLSLPFDLAGRTHHEIVQAVISEEPDKPSSKVSKLEEVPGFAASIDKSSRADLDILCLKAMHKDPDQRYSTVEALLRDVDHFLSGEPLEARPDSVRYRIGKFVRRNRRPVVAASIFVVAVVALIAFYTFRLSVARDTAITEAARVQRIQRFMLDLFKGEDDLAGPQKGLQVTTLLDRGVLQARALDGDPKVQADLYQTLGEVYYRLSVLDRAEELLEETLEQRRRLMGEEHPDVADTLMTLGLLREEQGELDEAEDLTREALRIVQAHLTPEHPRFPTKLRAVGSVLLRRGRYEDALPYLEEAIRLQEARNDEAGLIVTLGTSVAAHYYLSNYETSDNLSRRRLGLTEKHFGSRHPVVADALMTLGASRASLGYPVEAESFYRRAMEINEAYYEHRHPELAYNRSMLARVLIDQERFEEAMTELEVALAIREEVYGPNHYNVALSLNSLARLQIESGDLDSAEASFLRELAIYRATVGDQHHWTASAYGNLATVHFKNGHFGEAEENMRQSLAMYRAAFDPDHIDVAIAHVKLGIILTERETYREALDHLSQGHQILVAQANPSIGWIRYAREDIVTACEGVGDAECAAEYRKKLETDPEVSD